MIVRCLDHGLNLDVVAMSSVFARGQVRDETCASAAVAAVAAATPATTSAVLFLNKWTHCGCTWGYAARSLKSRGKCRVWSGREQNETAASEFRRHQVIVVMRASRSTSPSAVG